MSPRSPGALGLVSCWRLARHPPWHPACPSGQQPGSVHRGGAEGGWGWWESGFPEGGEEEVLRLAPQSRGGVVNLPKDSGGKGYLLAPCPPYTVPGLGGSACCMASRPLLGSGSRVLGAPQPLFQLNPRKTLDVSTRSQEMGYLEQRCRALASRPLPGSLLSLGSLLISSSPGPCLARGPCFYCPHLSGAPPKPSQTYSPWGWRGV